MKVGIFICLVLTFVGIKSNCVGRRYCGQVSTNALQRYNRFMEAVSKQRRSVTSRLKTNHVRDPDRKRSAGTQYEYAKSIRYNKPPVRIALPSTNLRGKSAYTTVYRNLVEEERIASLKARKQRIIQAQRFQILERIRQANQKPWWGQWSSWSACGRTCGCGVQFQERHCLGSSYSPTSGNGNMICEGSTRRYKICNSAPCPINAPSFRRLQCSQLAAKQVRGRYYSWKPYGHPVDEIVSNEPCQLVCVSDENEVQLNNVAMDGTSCRKGWNNGRCVDGKCQLIGCDGKINSTKLRNRCGKCNDDDASCVVHNEAFSHDFDAPGEIRVIRIPEGAYDILINEKRKSSSRIVVKDDNGLLLFDGGEGSANSEGWPRNTMIAGAQFRYRKPERQATAQGFEYLLSVGPLRNAIVVYIYATARGNTLVRYEFKTPAANGTSTSAAVKDRVKGGGVLSEESLEEISEASTSEILTTNETRSNFSSEPTPVAKHEVIIPPLRMNAENVKMEMPIVKYEFVDDETEDRADEGEDFLLIREIETIPVEPANDTEAGNNVADDSLRKPEKNRLIFTKPAFSPVDDDNMMTTGSGHEHFVPVRFEHSSNKTETIARVYTVQRQLPTANETESDNSTDYGDVPEGGNEEIPEDGGEDYDFAPGVDIPIPVRTRYNDRYLPRSYFGFHWRTSGFAPCSSTCRSGLQDSYATCERIRDHLTVDDSYCNPTTRPEPVRRSCANQTCEPRWEATPWSECSRSCGAGVQMRTVRCWRMIGPGFDSTLYNEVCNDVGGEKPDETKPCKVVDHCGPLWETSDWSSCPAPCGRIGIKWRTVRCSAGPNHLCAAVPSPHTEERCYGPKCVLNWMTNDWEPCSGVCGGGRKTRRVTCVDSIGRAQPEDRCDIDAKPTTSHPCGDENCRPEWITQDWEECSSECGTGTKTRTVLCSGIVNGEVHHYEDDTPCNGTPKPPIQEACRLRDCDPVWFTTSWSKCSVTCGSGHLVREVKCYQKNVPATGCDQRRKPSDREACNMPPCPAPPAAQCKNKPSVNCVLVVRVRLCSHWYYRKACCSSCQARRTSGK